MSNEMRDYLEQREKTLEARVAELEAALREAIEGWEDGAGYKGEYLAKKHGDAEGIARARAVLNQKRST